MKKVLLSMTLVLAMGLSFTSCRDTNKADDVDDAVEIHIDGDDVGDKAEGALEKTGKAIDNAAQETKEAGKAVGDAVKEVGDDN